jgi:hypothetical protein
MRLANPGEQADQQPTSIHNARSRATQKDCPMTCLPNRQHETFCQAYVRGACAGNLTEAYAAAGFARNSGNAKRLSQQFDIAARINELCREAAETEAIRVRAVFNELAISRARIVQELATMAFASPFDYVDEDGGPDLAALRAKGGALREVSIDTLTRRDGSTLRKLKIKLNDKRHALCELERMFRAATAPLAAIEERGTEEQAMKRVVEGLQMLADDGCDMADLFARVIPPAQVDAALRRLQAGRTGGAPGGAAPAEAVADVAVPPPLVPDAAPPADARADDADAANEPALPAPDADAAPALTEPPVDPVEPPSDAAAPAVDAAPPATVAPLAPAAPPLEELTIMRNADVPPIPGASRRRAMAAARPWGWS